jgi:hypothetical protein
VRRCTAAPPPPVQKRAFSALKKGREVFRTSLQVEVGPITLEERVATIEEASWASGTLPPVAVE